MGRWVARTNRARRTVDELDVIVRGEPAGDPLLGALVAAWRQENDAIELPAVGEELARYLEPASPRIGASAVLAAVAREHDLADDPSAKPGRGPGGVRVALGVAAAAVSLVGLVSATQQAGTPGVRVAATTPLVTAATSTSGAGPSPAGPTLASSTAEVTAAPSTVGSTSSAPDTTVVPSTLGEASSTSGAPKAPKGRTGSGSSGGSTSGPTVTTVVTVPVGTPLSAAAVAVLEYYRQYDAWFGCVVTYHGVGMSYAEARVACGAEPTMPRNLARYLRNADAWQKCAKRIRSQGLDEATVRRKCGNKPDPSAYDVPPNPSDGAVPKAAAGTTAAVTTASAATVSVHRSTRRVAPATASAPSSAPLVNARVPRARRSTSVALRVTRPRVTRAGGVSGAAAAAGQV